MAKKRKDRPRRFRDDFLNELFISWHKHRSQARFRGEGYRLSIEDYFKLWPQEQWQQRGRKATNLCLIRKDESKAWSLNNCQVTTRLFQLRRTNAKRKKSGPYMRLISD